MRKHSPLQRISKPLREKDALSRKRCAILVCSFLTCHCDQSTTMPAWRRIFWLLVLERFIQVCLDPCAQAERGGSVSICMVEKFLHVIVEKKQTEQRSSTRYPHIPFPLAMFHVLKFSEHLREVKIPRIHAPCMWLLWGDCFMCKLSHIIVLWSWAWKWVVWHSAKPRYPIKKSLGSQSWIRCGKKVKTKPNHGKEQINVFSTEKTGPVSMQERIRSQGLLQVPECNVSYLCQIHGLF